MKRWSLFLVVGTSWATATSPVTGPITPMAAEFAGVWVNGERKITILAKGRSQISIKTDGKFDGEANARGKSVLVADRHKWGKPTDDLTTTCALELTRESPGIRVKMAGDTSDCDLKYDGFYKRDPTK